jgi:oligopeptide transport system permease protein
MALSTPASVTRSEGASTAPSETSPTAGLRGQSPRSDAVIQGAARGTSLWRDGVRRLRRNRLAMAGGVVIVMLCVVAIFADVLAPWPYTKTNFGRLNEAPTRDYPLGTDQLGRDLLSRMIYGARVSMLVGLGAQVIVVLIGVPIGALSGYLGGRTDLFLTRFIDVMYAFPRLLFVILVMSMLGAGLTNIFIAIGLTGWVGIARQTRAQVLTIKEKEFVDAARGLGAGFRRLLSRHILPNALTPIVVAVTFGIPEAIFTEAALSFIGVGINPPTPSWGQMVGEGQQYIRSYWHLCVFPSIAIAITMLAFTFFGDGVRDALDPKLK